MFRIIFVSAFIACFVAAFTSVPAMPVFLSLVLPMLVLYAVGRWAS